jgi:wyosine [tRNA(Phe)-imidazoG37] synthetase (radical SAM superfamily)
MIEALEINSNNCKEEPVYVQVSSPNQGSDSLAQRPEKRRTSDKLINGLQFIKKKVYEKIAKTITLGADKNTNESEDVILIEDVLWVRPMRVQAGTLKIKGGRLGYYHKSGKKFEHISLFRNHLNESETLVEEWNLAAVEGVVLRRFLLKPNAFELFFRDRESVFFCLCNASE